MKKKKKEHWRSPYIVKQSWRIILAGRDSIFKRKKLVLKLSRKGIFTTYEIASERIKLN